MFFLKEPTLNQGHYKAQVSDEGIMHVGSELN
jgi:hypothetical protein